MFSPPICLSRFFLQREKKEEIIRLSIAYNITSKFTSFIAVEERKEGEDQTAKKGLSALPVFGPASVTITAACHMLVLLLLLLLACLHTHTPHTYAATPTIDEIVSGCGDSTADSSSHLGASHDDQAGRHSNGYVDELRDLDWTMDEAAAQVDAAVCKRKEDETQKRRQMEGRFEMSFLYVSGNLCCFFLFMCLY